MKQVMINKCVDDEGNVARELRFIDCMRFMSASLDKLPSNLKTHQFINLHGKIV